MDGIYLSLGPVMMVKMLWNAWESVLDAFVTIIWQEEK